MKKRGSHEPCLNDKEEWGFFFILLNSTADAQILVYFEKSISKAL